MYIICYYTLCPVLLATPSYPPFPYNVLYNSITWPKSNRSSFLTGGLTPHRAIMALNIYSLLQVIPFEFCFLFYLMFFLFAFLQVICKLPGLLVFLSYSYNLLIVVCAFECRINFLSILISGFPRAQCYLTSYQRHKFILLTGCFTI